MNRSRSSSFSEGDRHSRRTSSNSRDQRRELFGEPYERQQGNGRDGAVIVAQFQNSEGVQRQSIQSFHAAPRVESQPNRARDDAVRRYDSQFSRAQNVPATAANVPATAANVPAIAANVPDFRPSRDHRPKPVEVTGVSQRKRKSEAPPPFEQQFQGMECPGRVDAILQAMSQSFPAQPRENVSHSEYPRIPPLPDALPSLPKPLDAPPAAAKPAKDQVRRRLNSRVENLEKLTCTIAEIVMPLVGGVRQAALQRATAHSKGHRAQGAGEDQGHHGSGAAACAFAPEIVSVEPRAVDGGDCYSHSSCRSARGRDSSVRAYEDVRSRSGDRLNSVSDSNLSQNVKPRRDSNLPEYDDCKLRLDPRRVDFCNSGGEILLLVSFNNLPQEVHGSGLQRFKNSVREWLQNVSRRFNCTVTYTWGIGRRARNKLMHSLVGNTALVKKLHLDGAPLLNVNMKGDSDLNSFLLWTIDLQAYAVLNGLYPFIFGPNGDTERAALKDESAKIAWDASQSEGLRYLCAMIQDPGLRSSVALNVVHVDLNTSALSLCRGIQFNPSTCK